ncbi:MAG TPA: glycosyltransferase [Acidimicrobiia bacterium]
MRICLVAPNDALYDPRARVSRYVLEGAGHEVILVMPGFGPNERGVIQVDVGRQGLIRRLLGSSPEQRFSYLTEALAEAAAATTSVLYIPTDPRALDAAIKAARATSGAVVRSPKMRTADEVDLIDLAPTHPDLATPVAGLGRFHTPNDDRAPYRPHPGRHSGRKVVLCFRKSEINPGKYLEAGLRRSGAEVRLETEGIDLGKVDPTTDFVIFVEGPYPALEVKGETSVPVLFWFHHGEHHLHANTRLADRYRADAVLMAHSWHLAPWLPAPVHRFPFGMATELLDPSRRLNDRRYDVAMVGAKLRGGGPYGRRQQLVAELEAKRPAETLGFREQVSAEEMATLYGDSRIVINEGGTRHYPITMRVLEAVGSGAVLLSDRLPGMEMLLDEGSQYALLGEDVAADVVRLLGDMEGLQAMADSALAQATGLHTYDHRVDELFEVAEETEKRSIDPTIPESTLAAVIDQDVEVQRVAHLGAPELAAQLRSREIWDAATLSPNRLEPAKMETVAIRSDDLSGLEDLIRSARRYIYIEGAAKGLVEFLDHEAPQASVEERDGVTRVDLMAPSYRIMPFEVRDL